MTISQGERYAIARVRATEPLLLNVSDADLHVTSEQFDLLCQTNPDLRLELTSTGKLIVMAPTFGESGEKNMSLIGRVWAWNEQTELGKAFDSSTGYDFSAIGGGKMSPDVSWIQNSRIEGVSLKQFIPVVPDFAVELRFSRGEATPTTTLYTESTSSSVTLVFQIGIT